MTFKRRSSSAIKNSAALDRRLDVGIKRQGNCPACGEWYVNSEYDEVLKGFRFKHPPKRRFDETDYCVILDRPK